MKHLLYALLGICLIGTLASCSAGRHLEDGQYLLRKSTVKIKTEVGVSEKNILAEDLDLIKLQQPNKYLFGVFPYKVWLYDLRYKKYQKDSANFQITNRIVEKPVVYDSALTQRTATNMRSFLHNQGFYYSTVEDSVYFRNKKAFVKYQINTGYPYYIDSVKYQTDNREVQQLFDVIQRKSLFRKGTVFSNTLAGEERNRIVNVIRNYGFYKFSVDNISFELDTLVHSKDDNRQIFNIDFFLTQSGEFPQHNLNVKTIIHPSDDSLAFQKYHINKVVVFPDYTDSIEFNDKAYQTTTFNQIEFRTVKQYVHNGILDKKIFIRPGGLYSQEDYVSTLRQLNDLGIFRYIRIYLFEPSEDNPNHELNCYIIMNPNKKYDFQTNVEVSGGDLYVIGTAANFSVSDNNFLKGANKLTTSLSYGIEAGQNKASDLSFLKQFYLFSQNMGLNFRLNFPKFLLPINQERFSRHTLPNTFIDAGINNLTRINYFSLNSINGGFGYIWKESKSTTWTVKPVFINILHLSRIDPSFQARMDTVPAIKNSYQETFIEGEEIEFVYNTEGRHPNKYMYLKFNLEEAGALTGGIKKLTQKSNLSSRINDAHYVRLSFDTRQYIVRPLASVIFRFSGGVGIPYGNSTVLPYLKQYFTGGAYSIRGWRPRVLGPGSYLAVSNNPDDYLFIDQSGDIKLELNMEYRFKMITLFSGGININGAVFADAGNIWLARKDDKMPGAEFRFNKLFQDLAISTGTGLRFDLAGFLVVRFDWAFPLKAPYLKEDNGWVVDRINLASKDWRKQNLNLNLAIGYPF